MPGCIEVFEREVFFAMKTGVMPFLFIFSIETFINCLRVGGGTRYFRGGRSKFWRGSSRGSYNSSGATVTEANDLNEDGDSVEFDSDLSPHSQMSNSSTLSSSSLYSLLGGSTDSARSIRPSNDQHLAGPDHGILASHCILADLEYSSFLYCPSDFVESMGHTY